MNVLGEIERKRNFQSNEEFEEKHIKGSEQKTDLFQVGAQIDI